MCFVIKKKLTWQGRTNAQEGEQRISQRGGGTDKRRAGGERKTHSREGWGTEKRTTGGGGRRNAQGWWGDEVTHSRGLKEKFTAEEADGT